MSANPFPKRSYKPGTMHVTKVVAYHSHSGHVAYKLKHVGMDEIDLDPNLDAEIYRDALALVSTIKDMSTASYKSKVLELNPSWNVKYKWEERTGHSGTRNMMVATKITPCELTVIDLPEWATEQRPIEKLYAETNTGPAFVDKVLGLPRSTWPDYITCVEKINKAIIQPPKPVRTVQEATVFSEAGEEAILNADILEDLDPAYPQPDPDKLDEWFPRDKENTVPQTLEDEQAAQDKPKSNEWVGFWDSVKNIGNIVGIIDHHAYVHAFYDTDSVKDKNKSTMLKELKKHFDGVKAGAEELLPAAMVAKYANGNTTKSNDKPTELANAKSDGLAVKSEEGVTITQSNVKTPSQPASSIESDSKIVEFPKLPRTTTGISILNIGKELNQHLPPEAYKGIDYGQMSGKTDIDGDAVRDRFDKVFGPSMWRITPQQLAGRVEHNVEPRETVLYENKKPVMVDGKPKMKTTIWHVVTLVAHTFQYAVIMPDGSFTWMDGITTSDLSDNVDEQYAYRGAMTSLMKQFYRLMGGMNHVIYNEYTHVHAQRDLQRKAG